MRLLVTSSWCEDCGARVEVCQVRLGICARGFGPACHFLGCVLGAGMGLVAGLSFLYGTFLGLTQGLSGLVAFWGSLSVGWKVVGCGGLVWAVQHWLGLHPLGFCVGHVSSRLRRMARRGITRLFGLRGRYWRFATEPPLCGRCGSERIRPLGVESVEWALQRGVEVSAPRFYAFLRAFSAALLVGEGVVMEQRVREEREWEQNRRARLRSYAEDAAATLAAARRKASLACSSTDQVQSTNPFDVLQEIDSERPF